MYKELHACPRYVGWFTIKSHLNVIYCICRLKAKKNYMIISIKKKKHLNNLALIHGKKNLSEN